MCGLASNSNANPNLTPSTQAFKPESKATLQTAVSQCIQMSPIGDCSEGPHGSIRNWDVSGVTDMGDKFSDASDFNQDLSKWDVSAVTDMADMFNGASAFNQDLSKWDVSAVTNMGYMFYGASAFNKDLSKWDMLAVTNVGYMFHGASVFNQDLSTWDVSAVTDMGYMFHGASAFNKDLSRWDVSAVTDMRHMFHGAFAFKRQLCGVAWVNSKADKTDMFKDSSGSIASTVCTTIGLGMTVGITHCVFIYQRQGECECAG